MQLNISEKKFKDWLNHHNRIWHFFDQNIETFPKSFINKYKRPDFLIFLEDLGFILTDVKDKKLYPTYETFTIDETELHRLINLGKLYAMDIWFAISNENFAYRTWFWINANQCLKHTMKISRNSGEKFRAIPITSFIQVSWNESIGKIYQRKYYQVIK